MYSKLALVSLFLLCICVLFGGFDISGSVNSNSKQVFSNDNRPPIFEIINGEKPVLLKGVLLNVTNDWNTIITENQCKFKGGLKYLPNILHNVSVNSNSYFTYSQKHRPLYSKINKEELEKNEPKKENIPLQEFCLQVFNNSMENYYYFSEKISNLDKRIIMDINQTEWFVKGTQYATLDDLKIFLWMGSAGVQTLLHYDWSFNVRYF